MKEKNKPLKKEIQRTEHPSKRESLSALTQVAIRNEYGIALWRKPNSTTVSALMGTILPFQPNDLETTTNGFVFCPYDEDKSGHVISSKLTAHIDDKLTLEPLSDVKLVEQFHNQDTKNASKLKYYLNEDILPVYHSQDDFNKYVVAGIEEIKSGIMEKVVPARRKSISLNPDFDLINIFEKLCTKYPNAFISVLSTPTEGTWVGVTPEVLITINDNKSFTTVALAGTQKYDPDVPLSQVAWTQKEIEEQALVSRYIINCFKKIRLREFSEIGPKTIIAGNLMHLKTTYTVDMEATNFPQLGSVMLDLLHPTSAVCGMPKEEAKVFIDKHEGDSRGFYSGYLGPVNVRNETAIFVNLRCMQLLENTAILHSGAGLTEDSIPEKEWLETEMKMNTLLSVIKP